MFRAKPHRGVTILAICAFTVKLVTVELSRNANNLLQIHKFKAKLGTRDTLQSAAFVLGQSFSDQVKRDVI